MKLLKILAFASILLTSAFSAEFVSYDELSKKLKSDAKKSGMMALA